MSKVKPQKDSLHYDKTQQTTEFFSCVTFVIYGIPCSIYYSIENSCLHARGIITNDLPMTLNSKTLVNLC